MTLLDDIDFESVDKNGLLRWPLKKTELMPSYSKAARHFGIPDLNLFTVNGLPKKRRLQLEHLEINKNILKEKIFQIPLPIFRINRKLDEIFKNSNTNHCILNAPALELLHKNGVVSAVIIGTKNGIKKIEADHFFICCGALETPRLLLNSNLTNRNIGKYLMDHPKGYLAEVDLENNPLPKDHIFAVMKYYDNHPLQVKAGFTLRPQVLKENVLLNHNIYIKPIYSSLNTMERIEKLGIIVHTLRGSFNKIRDILFLLKNFPDLIRGLFYKYDLNNVYKKAGLFVVAEQTPYELSQVRLSKSKDTWGYQRAEVDWQIEKSDIENITNFLKIVAENLVPNSNQIYSECFTNKSYFDHKLSSAAHHMGTARMGFDKETGVVDSNLKVYGFDNLMICDASVFPSGGNANPSLTISALAFYSVDKYFNE